MQKFNIEYHTKSGNLDTPISSELFLRQVNSLNLACAHIMDEDGEYVGAIHSRMQENISRLLRNLYKT